MAFVYQSAIHSTPRLKTLLITKQPTKINYSSGERFDPAGMEVTAIYTNGSTKVVTDYTYSPTGALTESTDTIIISYTEKNITKTANVNISISTTLASISITKPPTKTVYNYNDIFSSAGMEVTATYSNGSTKVVSGWTVDTTTITSIGNKTITVSYTQVNITKTATLTIQVNAIKLTTPSQSNTLIFNGKSQSPTWNNYDSNQLTIGGTTSGVNATGYTATFTPKYGYSWEDGKTTAKNVNWQINRAKISSVPAQSGTLTYTGSSLTPTWNNYNASQLTIGGTTSAVNAGSYTVQFTPTANYMWNDSTTAAKSVNWRITKATPNLTLTKRTNTTPIKSLTLSTINENNDYCLRLNGGSISEITSKGMPSQSNSNSSKVVVSFSGGTIDMYCYVKFTPKADGSATIKITSQESTNYFSTTLSITVTVSLPKTLEQTSWETIKYFVSTGQLLNHFSIGDTKTFYYGSNELAAILVDYQKYSYYDYAIFQIGKKNGRLTAFEGGYYEQVVQSNRPPTAVSTGVWAIQKISNMPSNSIIKGFENSELQEALCRSTKSASLSNDTLFKKLPSEMQDVITPMYIGSYANANLYDKYETGDNVLNYMQGNTTFKAAITLPAEINYFGINYTAGADESSDNQQFAYYDNGNSKQHYSDTNNSKELKVWTRSQAAKADTANRLTYFVYVNSAGSGTARYTANYCYGIAPIFFITSSDFDRLYNQNW